MLRNAASIHEHKHFIIITLWLCQVHADPGIVRAPLADVASAAIVKEGKDAVANGGTQI